tara:strand:+ start:131 stop:997 length:867 start_codon:yes stop_codon:yes gene_type:complete
MASMPRIIHQTWKTQDLPEWATHTVDSWKTLNPTFAHWLWDDQAMADFIRMEYPRLWSLYSVHLRPVQKADLFRYAVVHTFGGIYADIDVLCVVPIQHWTTTIDHFNVNMVVGWEALPSKREVALKHFAVEHQLCQWTFGAMPQHWLLANLLSDIYDYYQNGKHMKDISIIKSTGPGMFSLSIKNSLRAKYHLTFGTTEKMDKKTLKNSITHIGGLQILPLAAFGSRGHNFVVNSGANGKDTDVAHRRLVIHHFQGSWKEAHKKRKKKFQEKNKQDKGRKNRGDEGDA